MLLLMGEASVLAEVVVHIPGVVDDELSSLVVVAIFGWACNIDNFVSVQSCQKHGLEIEQRGDGSRLIDPFSWHELLRGSMSDDLSSVRSSFAVGVSLIMVANHVEGDVWRSLDGQVNLSHAIQKVLHVVDVQRGTINKSGAAQVNEPNNWNRCNDSWLFDQSRHDEEENGESNE